MARKDKTAQQFPPPAPGEPAPQVVYVQAPKKKGKLKWIVLGIVAVVVIAAIAGSGGSDDAASTSSSNNSGSTASNTLPSITYDEIVAEVEGMTDIQFDRYAESIEGKRSANRWTATVIDVDDEVFGDGYYANLTTDPNDVFDLREMAIDIDEDTALSLTKGQKITFSGEISDLNNTLDLLLVELEDVTVHG